jgi:hypothetical protein
VEDYVVVIEQEKTGQEIRALLPGTVTGFTIPDEFLTPGTEYKLAIGTIGPEGNRSFVETSFTTAGATAAAGRGRRAED